MVGVQPAADQLELRPNLRRPIHIGHAASQAPWAA